jgi:hypothetical protein
MKTLGSCWFFSALVLLLPACAARPPFVLSASVGPPPEVAPATPGEGRLVVYSAWDGLESADADHEKHSSYAILFEDGMLVERVRNRCGSFEKDPMTVSLPAGTYRVEARASNFGLVSIPVLIKENQSTVVRLDGGRPPKGVGTSATDFVKLPNGQVVGWRAGEQGR